jgi:hypothetical protein
MLAIRGSASSIIDKDLEMGNTKDNPHGSPNALPRRRRGSSYLAWNGQHAVTDHS